MNAYQPLSALELLRQLEHRPDALDGLLDACYQRIDAWEPTLGAMTAIAPIARLRGMTQTTGPLRGLPVVVKDIFDTCDLPTSYGSAIYQAHRPTADAAMVTQLRRAGGRVLGKGVTCEFAYMAPTRTRNPLSLDRTAGGSSSGSAAAVAAGYAPFGIGSQTGGSTIRPASYCGIAGYKPTLGLLPTQGMKGFSWSFDTVGLFAAHIPDLTYFARSLTGSVQGGRSRGRSPVIGIPESYPWTQPSDNVERALRQAVEAAKQHGAHMVPIKFPRWMTDLVAAHHMIQSYEAYLTLGPEYDLQQEMLSPMLREFLQKASQVTFADYLAACRQAQLAKFELCKMFSGLDAILTPSAPDEAPSGYSSTGDPAFNRNWTLLGTPCVNVPGLRGDRGGAIGMQIIGLPYEDAQTLQVAAFLEQAIDSLGRRNQPGPD